MNSLFKILTVLSLCAVILVTLFLSTTMPNDQKNGFVRKWLYKELPESQIHNTKISFTNINGISHTSFFLSGIDPRIIFILSKNLNVKDTLLINYTVPEQKLVPNLLTVDSPTLYIHLNNLSTIIFGEFPNKELKVQKINTNLFTKSLQISNSTMVVRSLEPSLKRQVFEKVSCLTGEIITKNELIVNQEDMGISSDGILAYDNDSSRIFYIQYLTNNLYCLDSNLNLIYQSNTIDTTTTVKLDLSFEHGKAGKSKLVSSNARIIVNKKAIIYNNRIFIFSGLKADNEPLNNFNRNSVVDVYNTNNGKYVGSFYIKKINMESPKSLSIYNDTLYVLYGKQLVSHYLPKKLFVTN